MWRNFGKIWAILEKFWEILGNFEKFWEILPQFTHFHVEKNWAQKYIYGEKMTNIMSVWFCYKRIRPLPICVDTQLWIADLTGFESSDLGKIRHTRMPSFAGEWLTICSFIANLNFQTKSCSRLHTAITIQPILKCVVWMPNFSNVHEFAKLEIQIESSRGEICHCRHCRRQCKIFASGVNFSRNNAIYNINESTKYQNLAV